MLGARTKGSLEEPVRDLVDEKRVDFVARPDQLVSDTHEVFDDQGDLLDAEDDRAAGLSRRHPPLPLSSRRCGAQLVNIFDAEGTHPRGHLDGADPSAVDRGDEPARAKPRFAHCLTRVEHAARDHLAAGDGPAPGTNDVGLAEVADQFADLA